MTFSGDGLLRAALIGCILDPGCVTVDRVGLGTPHISDDAESIASGKVLAHRHSNKPVLHPETCIYKPGQEGMCPDRKFLFNVPSLQDLIVARGAPGVRSMALFDPSLQV